ncbi:MAG: acetyltransferase [Cetobacterium sp.]|uniref:acetyltransferase n=1 Tax=Cetobacterium sp. TaxID=2071632 RepID=UPI003EE5E8F4
MKKIYIVGSGGFAREVAWLIEDINEKKPTWEIMGFIDENEDNIGKELNGYKVLGNLEYLNKQEKSYVTIAIGTGEVREKISDKIKKHEFSILIHPSVMLSKFVNIGEGTIICAGSIVTTNIDIGNHVIINLDCTVGHDANLKNYTTILPSVNISGNVTVGERTMIGTGSAVIQGLGIGSDTIIGAGAIVVKNIPDNCTAVGNPAKPIKFKNK